MTPGSKTFSLSYKRDNRRENITDYFFTCLILETKEYNVVFYFTQSLGWWLAYPGGDRINKIKYETEVHSYFGPRSE